MKKLLSILIACLLAFSILGCTTKNNDTNTEDEGTIDNNIINDFESVAELQALEYYNLFGAVDLSTDTKYITSGKSSMQLKPMGDLFETALKPVVRFPLRNENADFSDLTKVKAFEFDAFNTSNDEIKIYSYINFGSAEVKTVRKTHTISAQSNAKLRIEVNAPILDISYDIANASHVSLEFDRQAIETEPFIYIDKFVAIDETLPFEQFDIELKTNEVISFDYLYQEYAVSSSGYGEVDGFEPILTINTDTRFAKSGKSLKTVWPEGNKSDYSNWPYFEIGEKIIQTAGLGEYGAGSTFSFWVYNPSSTMIGLYVDFWDNDLLTKRNLNTSAKPGGWSEVAIPYSLINELSAPTDPLTAKTRIIRVGMGEFVGGGDRTLYFDEFCIKPAK